MDLGELTGVTVTCLVDGDTVFYIFSRVLAPFQLIVGSEQVGPGVEKGVRGVRWCRTELSGPALDSAAEH